MPINAHPEYLKAEQEYQNSSTDEDRISALKQMIKFMPKHKSAEALRKNIRSRYKKLVKETSRTKKAKSQKKAIKKQEMQAVLVGLANSGKSSLLKLLTNAQPRIASYGFATQEPQVGVLNYQGCCIQIIDLPPINSENFDRGIVNNADTILIVIDNLQDIISVIERLKQNRKAKIIIVFNKIDLYDESIKRKIGETLKSKKYNFCITSAVFLEGIEELKEKIFNSFEVIRIYTKHQGKKQDNLPVIMPPNSTLEDVAEKILHGYSKKVKFAKITGPSSRFANQKVGLKHVVKDKDIVEFVTE